MDRAQGRHRTPLLLGPLTWSAVEPAAIAALRVEYETVGLTRAAMATDPFDEFDIWFGAAVAAGVDQPNTFVLATATSDGAPSARAVLMKDVSHAGLVFYTNTASRKGAELADNPRAAACFVWIGLHRQIRVEGGIELVDNATADEYFRSRPPGSRLAAAASPQSAVVESRAVLDDRWAELAESHPDGEVPRPREWGGYRLIPEVFEFWQGRPNRFHDRIQYRLESGKWTSLRLAP